MLNNNHLDAFAISSKGHLVKFVGILMLFIGSRLNLLHSTSATAGFKLGPDRYIGLPMFLANKCIY